MACELTKWNESVHLSTFAAACATPARKSEDLVDLAVASET
jgi:hypothetical protein